VAAARGLGFGFFFFLKNNSNKLIIMILGVLQKKERGNLEILNTSQNISKKKLY